MKAAGIDCGSTLVKAVHSLPGNGIVADRGSEAQMRSMLSVLADREGVGVARLTGTGWREVATALKDVGIRSVVPRDGLDDEIILQAKGAKWLFASSGNPPPKKAYVVSVGTGVSYTRVSGSRVKRSPLGGCHGGGTVMGIARLLGVTDFDELVGLAERGTAPDLLVKDMIASTEGTVTGELVISHFSRPGASLADNCAGIFSLAAASVAKDLAILLSIPFSPKEVMVVGSVGQCTVFLAHLAKHWKHLPKTPLLHVPRSGRFAAAVGAYLEITNL